MALFEIPSSGGYHSDIVFVRDPNSDRFFTHYSYTRGATANINEITDRRGIPSNNFRPWIWYETEFPETMQRIYNSQEYIPGESVLEASPIDQDFYGEHLKVARILNSELFISSSYIVITSGQDPAPTEDIPLVPEPQSILGLLSLLSLGAFMRERKKVALWK